MPDPEHGGGSDGDSGLTETERLAPDAVPVRSSGGKRSRFAYAVLISVPILWGTFTPSMKLLLDHQHAPPVILTNLFSHAVGTTALGLLWGIEALPRRRCIPEDAQDGGAAPTHRIVRATCELGVYLFFGQLTQLLGLGGTSATINAILVQSSVVIVPLFELKGSRAKRGGSSPWRALMLACAPSMLALLGIACITVVPQLVAGSGHGGRLLRAADANAEPLTTYGIACSLASAAFYALHTVRLSEYGDVDATVQATGQVAVNTVLDLLALGVSWAVFEPQDSPLRWLRHARRTEGGLALTRLIEAAFWNGLVVVGATTWGMSYAQRSFPASTAVVAYAMEPLFAALFAALFLSEALGPIQLVGGMLIVAANVVAGLRS